MASILLPSVVSSPVYSPSRIPNHDGLVAISARVARETNMNIEYSCVRTGVLVLHIQPVQVSEKADVMALVRRVLQEAAVKGKIDFLDIHVDEEGWNKC